MGTDALWSDQGKGFRGAQHYQDHITVSDNDVRYVQCIPHWWHRILRWIWILKRLKVTFCPRREEFHFPSSIVSRLLWRRHFTFKVQQLFWGKGSRRAQVRQQKSAPLSKYVTLRPHQQNNRSPLTKNFVNISSR